MVVAIVVVSIGVPIDGSLQTRAIELEKQRNADSLQRQLQQRSGILELIKSGILPEPTVAEQLRAGNVNFQKTSDAFGRIDRLRQPASLGSVPENDGITTDEEVAMEDDEYSVSLRLCPFILCSCTVGYMAYMTSLAYQFGGGHFLVTDVFPGKFPVSVLLFECNGQL